MAAGMTYTSLLEDLQNYAERTDDPFVAQLPRFVMLAENKIATEVRGLGLQSYVTSTLNGNTIAKPARWRETVSLNITTANGRAFLFPRSYDYCRILWPNPGSTAQPKYYADYGFEHILVAPSPDQAYPFELCYHERPTPLDENNQTNWTTQYAPQLLLYATLIEANTFLKRPELLQMWTPLYQQAASGVVEGAKRNFTDRTQERNSP